MWERPGASAHRLSAYDATLQIATVGSMRPLDPWIGWIRLAGAVSGVLILAGTRIRPDEAFGGSWALVAVIALLYGAAWLASRRLSEQAREAIAWCTLFGDAVWMAVASLYIPIPPSVGTFAWTIGAVYYSNRFGRPGAFAVFVVASLLAAFSRSAHPLAGPGPVVETLAGLAAVGGVALLTTVLVEGDRRQLRRLQSLATRDGLTGLYNHRFFFDFLDKEFSKLVREGGSISVLMLDIDQFKELNDSWGHLAGDEVLRTVAALLADSVRNHDYIFRYGGEEFAIVLPNSGAVAAEKVARRAHEKVRSHPFRYGRVTISVGWSIYPDVAKDRIQLVEQADAALYAAKERGRDRVVQYSPEIEETGRPAPGG